MSHRRSAVAATSASGPAAAGMAAERAAALPALVAGSIGLVLTVAVAAIGWLLPFEGLGAEPGVDAWTPSHARLERIRPRHEPSGRPIESSGGSVGISDRIGRT